MAAEPYELPARLRPSGYLPLANPVGWLGIFVGCREWGNRMPKYIAWIVIIWMGGIIVLPQLDLNSPRGR